MSAILVFHVAISVAGILSGLVVTFGFLQHKPSDRWNAAFLATSVLASLTGYVLPAATILPSHILGAVSLVALAVAVLALYRKQLVGGWRSVYVVAALTALYLNLFVGVAQAFLKVPWLTALAPTQAEPPFAIAQGVLFLLFVVAARASIVRFRRAVAIGTSRPVLS